MRGKLYGIGVGPGDPELLTLKAVKILKEIDIVISPKSKKDEDSIALKIVKEHLKPSVKIKTLVFPMTPCKETLERHWQENISIIEDFLRQGKKIAFLTLGDPLLYSTYIYILKAFKEKDYPIKTIPGITSFSAASSRVNLPLAEGDETLTILPLVKEDEKISKILKEGDNLVLLKASYDPEGLAEKFKRYGLEKSFIMISKCTHPDEKITSDINDLKKGQVPYLSTIIVKKGGDLNG